jgi:hypothetical protein
MENYGNHPAASHCMDARCRLLQGAGAKQPTFTSPEKTNTIERRRASIGERPSVHDLAQTTHYGGFSRPSISCTAKFNYHQIECNIQITSIHPSFHLSSTAHRSPSSPA